MMTPSEIKAYFSSLNSSVTENYRKVDAVNKKFNYHSEEISQLVFEAYRLGCIDLLKESYWWPLIAQPHGSIGLDEVLPLFEALPTAVEYPSQTQGIFPSDWSLTTIAQGFVRRDAAAVLGALDAMPPIAQSTFTTALVDAGQWPEGRAFSPAVIDAVGRGAIRCYANDQSLTSWRSRLGDAAWLQAVRRAFVEPGASVSHWDSVSQVVAALTAAECLAGIETVARSYENNHRAAVCALVERALGCDRAGVEAQLVALATESADVLNRIRLNTLEYNQVQWDRARRIGPGLGIALTLDQSRQGKTPEVYLDTLLMADLESGLEDIALSRAAFAALPEGRRVLLLVERAGYDRGLNVIEALPSAKPIAALIEAIEKFNALSNRDELRVTVMRLGGDEVRQTLQRVLGKSTKHQALYLRALAGHPHADVVSDAMMFAQGSSKPLRAAAVECLGGQGRLALDAVRTLLGAKKADLREAGVGVLEGLAKQPELVPEVLKLAGDALAKEKGKELSERLKALTELGSPAAAAKAPSALDALIATMPQAEFDTLLSDVVTREDTALQRYDLNGAQTVGPVALGLAVRWIEKTGGDSQKYRSYYAVRSVLSNFIEHPAAPEALVRSFWALGDKKSHAAKDLSRAMAVDSLVPHGWWSLGEAKRNAKVAEVKARLIEALGRAIEKGLPPQRDYLLERLSETMPNEVPLAFVQGLRDTAKGVRELSVKTLTTLVTPTATLYGQVEALTQDKAKATRESAEYVLALWQKAGFGHAPAATSRSVEAPAAEPVAVAVTAGALSDPAFDAALAAEKPLKAPKIMAGASWPGLRWRGGTSVSAAAAAWLVGRLGQLTEERHDTQLDEACARLDLDDAAALSAFIDSQYSANGEPKSAFEWVFLQRAYLASDQRLGDLGSGLNNAYDAKQYKVALLGLEVLRRSRRPRALVALERWACFGTGRRFVERAREFAEGLSAARGQSIEALVDGLYPHDVDPATALSENRTRWESAMVIGRVFPCDAWRAHFVTHPVLGQFTRGLVFVTQEPTPRAFAIEGEDPVGLDGKALSFEGVEGVKIVHPAALSEAEVKAWRARLPKAAHGFEQLDREVIRPTTPNAIAATLKGGALKPPTVRFASALRREGYSPASIEDGGSYGTSVRWVGRTHSIRISHDGIIVQTSFHSAKDRTEVHSVSLVRGDSWLDENEMPVGVVSDILVALDRFARL